MEGAAVKLAEDAAYAGAGTAEFLSGRRVLLLPRGERALQVEHPVPRRGSGSISCARRSRSRREGRFRRRAHPAGHAIEVRLNAEDPYRGTCRRPERCSSWRGPRERGFAWTRESSRTRGLRALRFAPREE
jgi:acetyl-CoA/propionyl-CoA carboxylase biotin carboxyl carrier protein